MHSESTSHGGSFHILDGISRILLVILAAVFPFFIVPLPYISIPQGKTLLIVILFVIAAVVWSFARLTEGIVHVPRSALVYIGLLLPVAYFISTLFTGWNSISIVGTGVEQDTLVAVTLMCGLFLLTALVFYGNHAGTKLLVQGFVAGLSLLYALQIAYIFLPSWFSFGVLSGQTANFFGSWHDLGIMAGLGLFLAMSLWYTDYFKRGSKALLVVLGVLSTAALLIVHFSDIFWGVSALFIVAAIAIIRTSLATEGHTLTHALQHALLWIVLAVVFALAGAFGTKVWDKLPAPIQITQTEVRPSWQGTFDVARQSLQAPSDFIFGAGPNSFVREWGLYKPVGVNATPFWDSDFSTGVGIIPTSIFTSGIVGLLAWSALILLLCVLIVRFLLQKRPLSPHNAFLGIALLSVSYLVVYHMIYTPGSALTGATFLALGLLLIAASGEVHPWILRLSTASIPDATRLFGFVIVVLATITAAGIAGKEVASNILVNSAAYTYQKTGNTQVPGIHLARALLLSPKNDRAHRAAAELGVIELSKLMAETDPQNKEAAQKLQNTLQTTIQHGLTAVTIDGSNYQNWLLLAQIYGSLAGVNVEGAYDEARKAYQRASEAHPTNPIPKLRLAQLAAAKNDLAQARTNLQEAIALKPDLASAYFLLSQIEAADNKGDAAVTAASNAVQLAPEDPTGWFNLGYILYAGALYNDAAVAFQQALQRAPDYANAMFYLGLSAYNLNQLEDAARIFDRVAELNPTVAWVPQLAANVRAGRDPLEGLNTQ